MDLIFRLKLREIDNVFYGFLGWFSQLLIDFLLVNQRWGTFDMSCVRNQTIQCPYMWMINGSSDIKLCANLKNSVSVFKSIHFCNQLYEHLIKKPLIMTT